MGTKFLPVAIQGIRCAHSKMRVLLERLSSLAPSSPALVTRWFLPPQFDFTSYQGVLFVMLMVLFFGGIILAVILPYQYVSDDPSPPSLPSAASPGPRLGAAQRQAGELRAWLGGVPAALRKCAGTRAGGCCLLAVQSDIGCGTALACGWRKFASVPAAVL